MDNILRQYKTLEWSRGLNSGTALFTTYERILSKYIPYPERRYFFSINQYICMSTNDNICPSIGFIPLGNNHISYIITLYGTFRDNRVYNKRIHSMKERRFLKKQHERIISSYVHLLDSSKIEFHSSIIY